MKQHRLRYAIADGGRARFVDHDPQSGHFRTVGSLVSDDVHDDVHVSGTAATRRVHEGDDAHHFGESHPDPHQVRKEEFTKAIGRALEAAAGRGEFERLVLVAPARVLGALRHDLSHGVQQRVVTELQKDLTRVPDHDLAEHLKETLRFAL